MPKKEVVDVIRGRRDYDALFRRFLLDPAGWSVCQTPVELNWESVAFDDNVANLLPNNKAGVYCFGLVDSDCSLPVSSFVLYVGKTTRNFRQRAKEYLEEAKQIDSRPLIQDMLVTWEGHLVYYFAPIDEVDKIDKVERLLINAYRPPFNAQVHGTISKKEAAKWKAK